MQGKIVEPVDLKLYFVTEIEKKFSTQSNSDEQDNVIIKTTNLSIENQKTTENEQEKADTTGKENKEKTSADDLLESTENDEKDQKVSESLKSTNNEKEDEISKTNEKKQ